MFGLFGCGGTKPEGIGVSSQGRLAPCPSSPTCVASDAADADHRIEPLRFSGAVEKKAEEGEECVVEVAIRAANELGDHATGTVVLSLPRS